VTCTTPQKPGAVMKMGLSLTAKVAFPAWIATDDDRPVALCGSNAVAVAVVALGRLSEKPSIAVESLVGHQIA
jgi:hypothetical protein